MTAHTNKKSFPKRLAISAAVAAALLSGYGSRRAYAGSCTGAAGTYTCSGAANSATDGGQNLNAGSNPLTVTTTPGFGIYANANDSVAFLLKTWGDSLNFTDNNKSSITASGYGMLVINYGTGATSITTTGTVTSTDRIGISARNQPTATDLTINAADVTGKVSGIQVFNYGTGSTSITTTGKVIGTDYDGIYAGNASRATDLTIKAADVTGGRYGIYANNRGTGSTSITTTGTVTGTSSRGIFARNASTATDLTINAVDVTGKVSGIHAFNEGTGSTSITTTGKVTGMNNFGIIANNSSTATDLTINAVDVSGGSRGIAALNTGSGTTTITVSGEVDGGIGIYNNSRNESFINLNSGASVITYGILAILDGNGNTTVTMNTGSSVTGHIDMGAGDDSIVLAGGNFSGVTQFNGGAGANDRLTFAGSNGVFDQSLMTGMEAVTIDNGSTMGLTFAGNAFNSIALTDSALIVQNGGILNASNGFTLTGNLVNSTGVVSMQNSTIDAPATINGNFTGGGQLLLDADFATDTVDKLNITGNVMAGGTQISVNDISTGPATGNDLTLVSVNGTTVDGDFTLATPVVNGAFNYNTLALVDSDWVLSTDAPVTGAPVYTPFAGGFEALGQNLLTLETLPTLADRNQQRLGGGANSGDETGIDAPVWVRIAGGYRDIDSNRSTTGANFDTNHWKAQIGADFTVADTASGRFVAGVNAGYSQADTDVRSTTGKSNIDTTGYSIGLSGTWYGDNGVYVDTQLQRSWYETDLSANGVGAGKVKDVDGDGYSASVEIGKDIALNDGLSITPQAQLIYAKVDTDTFTGANAELVKLSKSKSLKARIGAALTKRFSADGATQGYVIANVIHEFEDETQVNVSGAQLVNAVDEWSGELGLGMSHGWSTGTTSYQLSASMTGSTSLNNFGDSNAALGKVVFKVNF